MVIYDRKHAAQVDEFQAKLFKRYEMRNLGKLEWFLGIHITRLWLCQSSYIDKLTAKFKVDTAKRQPGSPQVIYTYQQRVGSLKFAAVITRPDIAHAASKLSEFLTQVSRPNLGAKLGSLRQKHSQSSGV